jgi:hypothetical protein
MWEKAHLIEKIIPKPFNPTVRFCRSDGFYFTLINTTNLLNDIYQPNKILIAPSTNTFFKKNKKKKKMNASSHSTFLE